MPHAAMRLTRGHSMRKYWYYVSRAPKCRLHACLHQPRPSPVTVSCANGRSCLPPSIIRSLSISIHAIQLPSTISRSSFQNIVSDNQSINPSIIDKHEDNLSSDCCSTTDLPRPEVAHLAQYHRELWVLRTLTGLAFLGTAGLMRVGIIFFLPDPGGHGHVSVGWVTVSLQLQQMAWLS